ncbi:MAG: response regulator, partial [Cyclobacteriaceae bacterium]
ELSIANKELAFQNDEKEKRAAELIVANKEVEDSRKSLERKAEQLALTSKYKSEFLANMSHELRSPLNSLLILAQQLYENAEGNLSDKQIRYAKTIHACGDDLIQLINDILDLSKIESGIISANIATVRIAEIASYIETTYKPISEARNLKFSIELDNDLPASMDTDIQRVNQILKNLLSNAFKFTEQGEVSLKIAVAKGWKPGFPTLDQAKQVVSFSITDTGIGIPREKQLVIFEAFQQAEGSTSRKYGGTGLGLSISRGLVELLGGTIELESHDGQGSTFTLYLPLQTTPNIVQRVASQRTKVIQPVLQRAAEQNYLSGISRTIHAQESEPLELVTEAINETDDDRSRIAGSDKVIMVIEHDLRFAMIMIEKAHGNGLKALVATSYQEVFEFLTRFNPIAITLDVNMPDTSGWKIIQMLRSDLLYSHIPVHVISGEENRLQALRQGARSFLLKPLENGLLNQLFKDMISFSKKETRSILIVEDNEIDASQIAKMLADNKISITIAATSMYALECIAKEDYDCIILDYTLPDISGNDLINAVSKAKKLFTPVIVYSVKDFSSIEMSNVINNSNAHIMKEVNSIENLITETVSQLHINHKNLAPAKRKIIESIRNRRDLLNGKNILVVDDDVRNLFAMTTVFERFNMTVNTADSGKEAISLLLGDPKIEMVLMDIMMPGMDGYEATRIIRQQHKNSTLPIIAVTAKAMKRDREKCLEAGASDYITKPVKTDQLLSLMRLWFCKQ